MSARRRAFGQRRRVASPPHADAERQPGLAGDGHQRARRGRELRRGDRLQLMCADDRQAAGIGGRTTAASGNGDVALVALFQASGRALGRASVSTQMSAQCRRAGQLQGALAVAALHPLKIPRGDAHPHSLHGCRVGVHKRRRTEAGPPSRRRQRLGGRRSSRERPPGEATAAVRPQPTIHGRAAAHLPGAVSRDCPATEAAARSPVAASDTV